MVIDFNPRNLKDQKIEIWGHNLVFLNPNPKYNRDGVPKEYEDWLNLIYSSFQKSPANYKINLQNKGIARAVSLIDYEKLDPDTLAEMKKAESRKVTEQLLKDESREEGRKEGREEKENTAIRNAIKKGKLSPSEIAEMLEVSLDRVLTLQKEMIT